MSEACSGKLGGGGTSNWGLSEGWAANCKHMLAGRQRRDGLQRDSVREAVSSPSPRPRSPDIFRTLGRSVSQRQPVGGNGAEGGVQETLLATGSTRLHSAKCVWAPQTVGYFGRAPVKRLGLPLAAGPFFVILFVEKLKVLMPELYFGQ